MDTPTYHQLLEEQARDHRRSRAYHRALACILWGIVILSAITIAVVSYQLGAL